MKEKENKQEKINNYALNNNELIDDLINDGHRQGHAHEHIRRLVRCRLAWEG